MVRSALPRNCCAVSLLRAGTSCLGHLQTPLSTMTLCDKPQAAGEVVTQTSPQVLRDYLQGKLMTSARAETLLAQLAAFQHLDKTSSTSPPSE